MYITRTVLQIILQSRFVFADGGAFSGVTGTPAASHSTTCYFGKIGVNRIGICTATNGTIQTFNPKHSPGYSLPFLDQLANINILVYLHSMCKGMK